MNDQQQITWCVAPTLHWMEEWGTWMRFDCYKRGGGQLSDKSLAAYLQSAKHFVRWFEQVRPAGVVLGMQFSMEHFTVDVMREYFAWQKEERVPAKSYNHHLITLRKIAKWAMLRGYIQGDPTRAIEPRHERESAPRKLETETVVNIQAVAKAGTHLKRETQRWTLLGARDLVIWFLFGIGLRVSEVADADLRDLDLENHTLRVIGKGNVEGKVKLTDDLETAIRAWLVLRADLRFAAQETKLLTDWDGLAITAGQVRRRLKDMGAIAGAKIVPHDMRHFTIYNIITTLVSQGVPLNEAILEAQTQGRHGDPRTTWSYQRPSMDQVRSAMAVR